MRDALVTVGTLLAVCCVCTFAAVSSAEYSVTDIVGAARRGDGHAVRKLIELDPDLVKARDDRGDTPLHWAAIRGHWRIVAELVVAGAPVNAIGADGGTPLHRACHHDRADMVGLLLDAGADPNLRNQWGRTPLHVAARRGCGEVAELLIQRGADPNSSTNEGWTPLHVAYLSGHDAVVRVLLSTGCDPEQRDDNGLRPAEVARARPQETAIDRARLDDFVGIYELGGDLTVKVWRDGDKLGIREFAPDLLYPIGPDRFFCRQEPWRITFNRSETGAIDGVELELPRGTVHGIKSPKPHYVGSRVCRECHSDGPHRGAWVSWLRSGHANAYWRLAGDWALYLARLRPYYSDVEDPMSDRRCLLCHATAQQDDDALTDVGFRLEEGVSCEACHGPGSLYIDPEVMTDRDRFLVNGGVVPDAATCRGCHRNSERFDFDSWSPKIAHARSETRDREDRDRAR